MQDLNEKYLKPPLIDSQSSMSSDELEDFNPQLEASKPSEGSLLMMSDDMITIEDTYKEVEKMNCQSQLNIIEEAD